ncbi:putative fatty acyl-CoA reductase CG5065 isoform X3 [Formica exsecta]|uniref:putative fatty acyl-CoA reductase CG5065 isoform X3 n=1 Tax=Formica exsecta TaxID=72781 RepID=UPI001142B5DE|nr:putative fatty acyl-CoA reductase CG5065 isoform X3 [Formica exsecta]
MLRKIVLPCHLKGLPLFHCRIINIQYDQVAKKSSSLITMEPGELDSADAPDRIVETFAGRKIMLTGGTGFLGKVILEKFLRCLPEIAQIYMLIRLKKGKDPKQRLLEILNSPVSYS